MKMRFIISTILLIFSVQAVAAQQPKQIRRKPTARPDLKQNVTVVDLRTATPLTKQGREAIASSLARGAYSESKLVGKILPPTQLKAALINVVPDPGAPYATLMPGGFSVEGKGEMWLDGPRRVYKSQAIFHSSEGAPIGPTIVLKEGGTFVADFAIYITNINIHPEINYHCEVIKGEQIFQDIALNPLMDAGGTLNLLVVFQQDAVPNWIHDNQIYLRIKGIGPENSNSDVDWVLYHVIIYKIL